MIDLGNGTPVVLIPGSQGRWEWMQPAVDALARRCRVLTYSLCGEPGSDMRIDPDLGFDSFVNQLDDVLDRAGVERATLCGVSYGGWIALRYAALRPNRTRGLVIVSTPGPAWRPDARLSRYLRAPRLMSPLFVLASPARLYPEIARAIPAWRERIRFSVRHTWRVMLAPLAPGRTAERAHLVQAVNLVGDCGRIAAPVLVITGEPGLDKVVPVESTKQYAAHFPEATFAILEQTGHIGHVTRPDRFADLVAGFADACESAPASRRRA
jgi:pimeloyl-ACP methyl ester carboxylesterase